MNTLDPKAPFDALESDKEAAKERWLKLGQKAYNGSPPMSEFLGSQSERTPMLSDEAINFTIKNSEYPERVFIAIRDHYEDLIDKGVLRVVKTITIKDLEELAPSSTGARSWYHKTCTAKGFHPMKGGLPPFCPGCGGEIQKPQ